MKRISKQQKKTNRNKPRKIIAAILIGSCLLIATLAGLGSGYMQYGAAHIICGKAPVAASKFMASYSYDLPGDTSYGPNPFNEYYCSETDAKKAGFHASTFSDTAKKEAAERSAAREEARKFSPEKIDYTLYVPFGRYTAGDIRLQQMNDSQTHSFFNVKEDGYNLASIREGKIPSSYELCTNENATCTVIGKDSRGGDVRKQIYETRKRTSISYTVNIGSTFINLTAPEEFTDQDAINLFNTFKEYGSA